MGGGSGVKGWRSGRRGYNGNSPPSCADHSRSFGSASVLCRQRAVPPECGAASVRCVYTCSRERDMDGTDVASHQRVCDFMNDNLRLHQLVLCLGSLHGGDVWRVRNAGACVMWRSCRQPQPGSSAWSVAGSGLVPCRQLLYHMQSACGLFLGQS